MSLGTPTTQRRSLTKLLTAMAITFGVATPAAAAGITDYLDEARKLASSASDIDKEVRSLAKSEADRLRAKLDRAKLAGHGVKLFLDDVKDGKPAPWVLEKPGAATINCGDKIWMANTVNGEVLQSETGSSNKVLDIVAVNLGWNGKEHTSGPNVTVECKDKSNGQAIVFGDKLLLRVDPAVKKLDDGKPYLLSCTECGSEPLVRMYDKAKIHKDASYWSFSLPGASGAVPTGIPVRLVATNRQSHGNIGGFCGVGSGGLYPTVRFNFHNHCDQGKLGAAIAAEELHGVPQWIKGLAQEAKQTLAEVKDAASRGGSGGSGGKGGKGSSAPAPKMPTKIFG